MAIGIGSVLTACTDYLETPTKSSLDEQVIFSTPDLAKGAVDGIKVWFGQTNSYRGRFLPYYGLNSDIEWFNNSHNSGANTDLVVYDSKPNNTTMNTANNAWAMMYSGIEQANLCIRGLRTYGDIAPGTELGYLLGEALTLRAVYYADLVRGWGDVVPRFDPITTNTIYIPKTSRDEIYKQLIADLGEATELVPWPNETAATGNVERINKAFVKGFRARLMLAASGYSQYPDGIRQSTDPELSVANMYPLALQECMDIIERYGEAKLPSFERVFRDLNEEKLSASGESLWEIPFAEGRGRMHYTFAVRHRSSDQHTQQPQGGVAGPLPTVFYDFDEKDTRRDVTCVPYEWGTAVQGFAKQQLTNLDVWAFGKFRYEWMDRLVTSTNDDGINKVYMRYAEVVLMAAEINNQLTGPGAAAPYLKMIRRRAFKAADWPAKVDAYVDGLATSDAMFNAIVDEHKFEFCGEMLRKEALIRWDLLKDKMDEAKIKMDNLRNLTGEYADVPATLYYRYAPDGESLEIFGLNRGETTPPVGDEWTSVNYINPTRIADAKIESIYAQDPNTRQFWPIWEVFISNSNGTLVNDYGY